MDLFAVSDIVFKAPDFVQNIVLKLVLKLLSGAETAEAIDLDEVWILDKELRRMSRKTLGMAEGRLSWNLPSMPLVSLAKAIRNSEGAPVSEKNSFRKGLPDIGHKLMTNSCGCPHY